MNRTKRDAQVTRALATSTFPTRQGTRYSTIADPQTLKLQEAIGQALRQADALESQAEAIAAAGVFIRDVLVPRLLDAAKAVRERPAASMEVES